MEENKIIQNRINTLIDSLLSDGISSISSEKLYETLNDIAQVSFNEGSHYARKNLIPASQAAKMLGVSVRRVSAIAINRNNSQEFISGFGVKVPHPNGSIWLFTPDEIDSLKGRRVGRRPSPKKEIAE